MQFNRKGISIRLNYITCTVILPLLLFITGCYNNKEELLYPGSTTPVNCTTAPATFKTHVQPLIVSKCAIPGCHDGSNSTAPIFGSYLQISLYKNVINTRVIVQQTMPPTGPLPPADVSKLKCWIEAGGLDN